MTDKFTIKIPREDGERHNERRQELGLTWLEYIDGQAPTIPNCGEVNLDGVESSLATIEERTGRIEKQLDDLGGQR